MLACCLRPAAQEAAAQCPSLHYYYLGFYLQNCHRMRYKVGGTSWQGCMGLWDVCVSMRCNTQMEPRHSQLLPAPWLRCKGLGLAHLGLVFFPCPQGDYAPADLLCPKSKCWVPLDRCRAALDEVGAPRMLLGHAIAWSCCTVAWSCC